MLLILSRRVWLTSGAVLSELVGAPSDEAVAAAGLARAHFMLQKPHRKAVDKETKVVSKERIAVFNQRDERTPFNRR